MSSRGVTDMSSMTPMSGLAKEVLILVGIVAEALFPVPIN